MSVTLSFKIEGDHLIRLDTEKITNKTRNYILLDFTSFSEDWDELDIYLILQDEQKNNYLFDLNEETPTVTVPEIVLRGGFFKLTVFGFNERIRPVEPGDYSKDIFEEFIGKIDTQVEVDLNDFIISLTEGIRS